MDTSALVGIYLPETDAAALQRVLATADRVLLPASCIVEFAMLHRLAGNRRRWLSTLVEQLSIQLVAIGPEVADIAASAAERYGRGSGHRSRLNFGDCLSYAVAKHLQAPLLYKGGDFHHTDIESALPA